MKALIIVDVQNDFCPGGALPAPHGDAVIPVINHLMNRFDLIIASRDAHPEKTEHFKKWPPHCIEGTKGAAFHPMLDTSKIKKEFVKGTGNKDDGYSAFEATNADMTRYLKDHKVSDIFIVGLTTEYCVKNTALDGVRKGFNTVVVANAIAAVEPDTENEKQVLVEMKEAGISLLKLQGVHQL